MSALRGEQPDAVPIMLHNFLLAIHEAKRTHREYRESPRVIADTLIQAVETYHYDGILVDIDTATLAGAVGVPVDYPENQPARCEAPSLTDLSAVADLGMPRIAESPRIQVWLEAVRLLRAHFGNEILIRGNCDQAPFSLASMMRTPEVWMMDLLDEDSEEAVQKLLAYCAQATTQFVELMAQAGAHIVSNGDSPAGPELISPDMYRRFALPGERQVVAAAHKAGMPYVLHICGKTDAILADMVSTGADALELDYRTDLQKIRAALDGRATFIGNIDPSGVLTFGTPELVAAKTRELLEQFAGVARFVLNAGCAIPAETPPANLKAMIRTARAFTGTPYPG
ncbi:MAG: uroporphyrinogen decarboxylase family protein [Opitutae bacterium]|nr:uroporphyrinogen decarboxylase family protein [Opitutae bacterium]